MGSLYTKFKMFYFKDKIDSLPLDKAEILPPTHIRIKPTNMCNHRCTYCAYLAPALQLGQDMVVKDFIPRKKMLEIVDDIISMGVRAVTFSGGGEPFCYPYLLDTARRLASSPVKFAALTNGSLVKGEIAEVFAHSATWLRISMDGWDDISYMKYRGVSDGEFTKILSNIVRFKKLKGKCYLGVSIIIDRGNVAHIFDLVKVLKESGVDSVKFSPCIVSNSGVKNNEYHAAIFQAAKDQISRSRSELEDKNLEIFDSYHEQLSTFKKEYAWCPYLQVLPVIGADLNVYSCHDKAYNLAEGLLGSIKDKRLRDFWFSDKNNFFKINPSVHCNHHCVAHERNRVILDYLNVDREHLEFV